MVFPASWFNLLIMLPSKTVFVVGAGASHEVGLPVGNNLKATIAQKLDLRFERYSKFVGAGDLDIYQILRQKFGSDTNNYLEACWRIRDGVILSSSIDDFIDAHQHDKAIAICGKLAIAQSILDAERASKLYYKRQNIDDTVNFRSIAGTWYMGFYELLTRGVKKTALDTILDNVTIISFNYDRCIEHFLVHALATHYQVAIEQAQRLIAAKLTIYHPYGVVGPIFGSPSERVEFGSSSASRFENVMKNIRTYSEQIEDDASVQAMQKAMKEADVIVFLGTAFHPNNMALLTDNEYRVRPDTVTKRIYATRQGTSDADLTVVFEQFSLLCGIRPPSPKQRPGYHLAPECRDLFNDFRMSLRR